MHGRVPAEVGEVEPERETGLEEVLAFFDLIGFIVNVDSEHKITFDTDLHGSKS